MDAVVFGLMFIALIGAFAYYVRETNQEKSKLINALVAKNPEQLRDLTLADKVVKIKQQPLTPPDLVPENALSHEEWLSAIKNGLANQEQMEEVN